MKRFYGILLMVITVIVLAACGSSDTSSGDADTSGNGGGESSGKAKTLKASSGVTDEHFWDRGFFSPLIEGVEEGSDGEVKFDKFVAGELVELGNELEALQSGRSEERRVGNECN